MQERQSHPSSRRTSHRIHPGLLCLLSLLLVLGCVTPVIPLPPPVTSGIAITQVDATAGTITLTGADKTTQNGAFVYIFNRDLMVGIIFQAGEKGGWSTGQVIQATHGHQLDIWAQRAVNEDPSDTVSVIVDTANKKLIKKSDL